MIYFVRHGQTVSNRAERLQGQSDSPLTLRGVELAMQYGAALRERVLDPTRVAIFTSPLGRARQTATILADALGVADVAIEQDALLVEQAMGRLEGLTWDEIEPRFGIARGSLRDWDLRPPGGETRREVLARAQRWLARPRAAQISIVVSHGGFSRTFRGTYLGLDLDRILALPTHDHGRFFELDAGGETEHVVSTAPGRDGR